MVYLPLSKVADTPFQIQGNEIIQFWRRLFSTNRNIFFHLKSEIVQAPN